MKKEEQERLYAIYSDEAHKHLWEKKCESDAAMRRLEQSFRTMADIGVAHQYAMERLAGRKEPFNLDMDLVDKRGPN